jgi:hypothetical protein
VSAYVGLIEVIFLPSLLFTHSLLMKRPIGWMYFLPLGAVSSMERSDIFLVELKDWKNEMSSLIALLMDDGRRREKVDRKDNGDSLAHLSF